MQLPFQFQSMYLYIPCFIHNSLTKETVFRGGKKISGFIFQSTSAKLAAKLLPNKLATDLSLGSILWIELE